LSGLIDTQGGKYFMAGKFLKRDEIIDVIKSQERISALQKRAGLSGRAVRFTTCGCPDPACGGWHTILQDLILPTDAECAAILKADNGARKRPKPYAPPCR
jgi:hypothetical protein